MKQRWIPLIAIALIVLATARASVAAPAVIPVRINELMAVNTAIVQDEAGDYEPWIELYNASATEPWDLGGMYLSTNPLSPTMWSFPAGTVVEPGDALLVWADSELGEGSLHANVAITPTGALGLYNTDALGNALVDVVTYTALATNTAYGRLPDGAGAWQVFGAATPGWPNEGFAPFVSGVDQSGSDDALTITAVVTDDDEGIDPPAPPIAVPDGWQVQYMPLLLRGATPPIDSEVTAVARWRTRASGGTPSSYISSTLIAQAGQASYNYRGIIDISGWPAGTWIEYIVVANDEDGNQTVRRPTWVPGEDHYRYVVGWQHPGVYINEFMADNDGVLRDAAGEYDDWVELYNSSSMPVDIGGMYLSDDLANPQRWMVPASTTIPAGDYVLVWLDGDTDQGPLHASFSLSRQGEDLILTDATARFNVPVDAVTFDAQRTNVSLGRLPDGSDWHTTDWALPPPTTWRSFSHATPGATNVQGPRVMAVTRQPRWPSAGEMVQVSAVVTATNPVSAARIWYRAGGLYQAVVMTGSNGVYQGVIPAQASLTEVQYYLEVVDADNIIGVYPPEAPSATDGYLVGYEPPPIVINELLAANQSTLPDEADEYDDWIELHNAGDTDVDVGGMYLSDDLTWPTKWMIPVATVIPAGGYVLIWCDEDGSQGALHANFQLNRAGEEVGLYDTGDVGNTPLDIVVYETQIRDVSWGRVPDGSGAWTALQPPSPWASNTTP
jgi:hypothetical protein